MSRTDVFILVLHLYFQLIVLLIRCLELYEKGFLQSISTQLHLSYSLLDPFYVCGIQQLGLEIFSRKSIFLQLIDFDLAEAWLWSAFAIKQCRVSFLWGTTELGIAPVPVTFPLIFTWTILLFKFQADLLHLLKLFQKCDSFWAQHAI